MRLLSLFLLLACLAACQKTKVTPVSERIRKVWVAQLVQENAATVYTRGAINTIRPAYGKYQLDLSSAGIVKLTETDGNTFLGQWQVSPDGKTLILNSFSSEPPTGTNGRVEYSIVSAADNALTLLRNSTNLKTGAVNTQYQLIVL